MLLNSEDEVWRVASTRGLLPRRPHALKTEGRTGAKPARNFQRLGWLARPARGCLLAALTVTLAGAIIGAWGSPVSAREEFVRQSLRARAMGNAFTAVANDEYALFYNPAGLKAVPRYMFEFLSAAVGANETLLNLGDTSSDSGGGDDFSDKFSDLSGETIYTEVDFAVLSITAPGWGYSLFGNLVADFGIQNPVVPFFDVRLYVQAGLAGGGAFTLMDDQLDLGVTFKAVTRTGVIRTYHLVDFAPLISGDFDTLDDIVVTETAYAPDVGATYHWNGLDQFPMKFSAVAQNVGSLNFHGAGSVPMTVNLGASSEIARYGMDFLFAADMLDVFGAQPGEIGYAHNVKLGVEAAFLKLYNGHHLVALRLGRNGFYNSFGFSLNIWGLVLEFAKWSDEIGQTGGTKEDKRQAARISFTF